MSVGGWFETKDLELPDEELRKKFKYPEDIVGLRISLSCSKKGSCVCISVERKAGVDYMMTGDNIMGIIEGANEEKLLALADAATKRFSKIWPTTKDVCYQGLRGDIGQQARLLGDLQWIRKSKDG